MASSWSEMSQTALTAYSELLLRWACQYFEKLATKSTRNKVIWSSQIFSWIAEHRSLFFENLSCRCPPRPISSISDHNT